MQRNFDKIPLFSRRFQDWFMLFKELEERETLACGLVRLSLPKEVCSVKEKKVKKLKRGESLEKRTK